MKKANKHLPMEKDRNWLGGEGPFVRYQQDVRESADQAC